MLSHLHAIARAVGGASRDFFRRRVLIWVIAPLLCALLAWVLAAWFLWTPLNTRLDAWLAGTWVGQWLGSWGGWARGFVALVLTVGMLAPMVSLTALVVTTFFLMPVLVDVVSAHHYPALERKRSGSFAGSVLNTVFAITLFLIIWVVTLPLWFTGVGALVVPMLNSALLNQRVFRYDALSEHADAEEFAAIIKTARKRLFGLALVLSPLSLIPLANLIAPVIVGLAFVHLCLHELQQLREGVPDYKRMENPAN